MRASTGLLSAAGCSCKADGHHAQALSEAIVTVRVATSHSGHVQYLLIATCSSRKKQQGEGVSKRVDRCVAPPAAFFSKNYILPQTSTLSRLPLPHASMQRKRFLEQHYDDMTSKFTPTKTGFTQARPEPHRFFSFGNLHSSHLQEALRPPIYMLDETTLPSTTPLRKRA